VKPDGIPASQPHVDLKLNMAKWTVLLVSLSTMARGLPRSPWKERTIIKLEYSYDPWNTSLISGVLRFMLFNVMMKYENSQPDYWKWGIRHFERYFWREFLNERQNEEYKKGLLVFTCRNYRMVANSSPAKFPSRQNDLISERLFNGNQP